MRKRKHRRKKENREGSEKMQAKKENTSRGGALCAPNRAMARPNLFFFFIFYS
jgi:hypothetical protein